MLVRNLLSQILVAGILLGVISGFLSGMARSPVAGVAITGLLGLSAAAVNIGADRLSMVKLRWHCFAVFAAPFAIAFMLALFCGMYVRATQPSTAERLGTMLKTLGLTNTEIAEQIAAAVIDSPQGDRLVDSGFILYSRGASASLSTSPARETTARPEACDRLKPSTTGYTDQAWFNHFEAAGEPFSRLAEYVVGLPLEGITDQGKARLQMLAAGHYGICGP